MRDVELFVRYIAFNDSLAEYKGNLKSFLDNECKRLNGRWANDESEIRRKAGQMEEAISASFEIFGDDAFRSSTAKYTKHDSTGLFLTSSSFTLPTVL